MKFLSDPQLNVVLVEPQIPPNTGNIIRLCANTGCSLHLIHPLGFRLEDKQLQRAGLDYHEFASIKEYESYEDFLKRTDETRKHAKLYACTTKARVYYTEMSYQSDDFFLFGPESRGLPLSIIEDAERCSAIKIPMQPQNRSLNLSNAVAVIIYEAWRQVGFSTFV